MPCLFHVVGSESICPASPMSLKCRPPVRLPPLAPHAGMPPRLPKPAVVCTFVFVVEVPSTRRFTAMKPNYVTDYLPMPWKPDCASDYVSMPWKLGPDCASDYPPMPWKLGNRTAQATIFSCLGNLGRTAQANVFPCLGNRTAQETIFPCLGNR